MLVQCLIPSIFSHATFAVRNGVWGPRLKVHRIVQPVKREPESQFLRNAQLLHIMKPLKPLVLYKRYIPFVVVNCRKLIQVHIYLTFAVQLYVPFTFSPEVHIMLKVFNWHCPRQGLSMTAAWICSITIAWPQSPVTLVGTAVPMGGYHHAITHFWLPNEMDQKKDTTQYRSNLFGGEEIANQVEMQFRLFSSCLSLKSETGL